jgi:hypothetical protein
MDNENPLRYQVHGLHYSAVLTFGVGVTLVRTNMANYTDEKTTNQLNNNFKYHAPTAETIPAFEEYRARCRELGDVLNRLVPASREKSEALTHLEDVMMWGNAGIARNIK